MDARSIVSIVITELPYGEKQSNVFAKMTQEIAEYFSFLFYIEPLRGLVTRK
jgi:hypothetical protein